MSTPPAQHADTARRRTDPAPSPQEPVVVTPAVGPVPAIHIPKPPTDSSALRRTLRATVRAARRAVRRTDRRNHA